MSQTLEQKFEAASSPAAAPVITPGATSFNTPEAIERFRQIALLSGLKLESKGIRMSRGVSCLAIARRDYGIKAKNAGDAHGGYGRRGTGGSRDAATVHAAPHSPAECALRAPE